MIEVIPNWHPLFVHFVVALLSMSTFFFIILKISSLSTFHDKIKTMAYWNLWFGTGFAIITAIAGWFAYNSVAHDTPSHAAMTDHRNWALVTLSVYIVISFWSLKQFKNVKNASMSFTIAIILASALLVSTGWRGSELVYRHGLGVMSLPKVEGEGHAHEHTDGEGHSLGSVTVKKKITHDDSLSTGANKNNVEDHSSHKH